MDLDLGPTVAERAADRLSSHGFRQARGLLRRGVAQARLVPGLCLAVAMQARHAAQGGHRPAFLCYYVGAIFLNRSRRRQRGCERRLNAPLPMGFASLAALGV